mgnify:CR=1 FL=1
MTLPYPLLARGKIIDTDMWIFFDTATPKRGVQLSHDIESVTCEDKAIKFEFREEQGQFSLNSLQPSKSRKVPILVCFPSKEDANTAFVGMAEQMAEVTGNWFVSPAPEPKGPFTGGIGSDNRTYPFTNEHGKHFRIEYDGVFNSIIIAYEDGVNVRHTLDELPHAGK